jgi:uncharacterized protein (TIGR02246 family)
MQTKHGFWLALVAVALAQLVAAAQRQAISAEQQVIAIDDQRTDALRRGDPLPLERIYADDYTLVTGTGQIRSKADQIAELKSGELRYANIDIVDRKARLYGDVAVIVSRQSAVIFQGGRQITSGDERVTRVYKKIEGAWRVIATHATPIR